MAMYNSPDYNEYVLNNTDTFSSRLLEVPAEYYCSAVFRNQWVAIHVVASETFSPVHSSRHP
jgi:hypothetical protein